MSYVTKIEEVTKERYWEMLEVLPPLNWHRDDEGKEVFFMSEFYTETYTEQFCEMGGKYYEKRVNFKDRSTWIKRQEINELNEVTA